MRSGRGIGHSLSTAHVRTTAARAGSICEHKRIRVRCKQCTAVAALTGVASGGKGASSSAAAAARSSAPMAVAADAPPATQDAAAAARASLVASVGAIDGHTEGAAADAPYATAPLGATTVQPLNLGGLDALVLAAAAHQRAVPP